MRRAPCAIVVLAVVLGLGACRERRPRAQVRVRETRMPMGTYMTITVYAPTDEAGRRAIAAAFERVEQVEAAISAWRRESDASKLNRAAGGEPVPIGPHLVAVLRRAAEISTETGGAFDVTVGPLVRLWKRSLRRRRLPTDAELAEARGLVGYRAVELDAEAGRARLARKGMRVDFGAIGKGYIVDQAVRALRDAGIAAALVDAGGDIYALGSPPERAGWLVGVRDPARPDDILGQRLLLRHGAVATSGDYEQFVEIDGRRYSHILDPRTGRPVEQISSVTVLAPDATTADAYATSASVLGPKAAVAFAESRDGVEILLLHRDGDKLLRTRSSGFDRHVASDAVKP